MYTHILDPWPSPCEPRLPRREGDPPDFREGDKHNTTRDNNIPNNNNNNNNNNNDNNNKYYCY